MTCRNSHLAGYFLIMLIFYACQKDIQPVNSPQNYRTNNFTEVFNAYWNGMNNEYVYWSIDTTNWDNMYKIYQHVFSGLDISSQKDNDSAYAYFRKMTSGLIDSHYFIQFY